MEDSFDIAWHGYVNISFVVVPVEGEAKVLGAVFVDSDGVEVAESSNEMFKVFTPNLFDSKVIHDKCERNWPALVTP